MDEQKTSGERLFWRYDTAKWFMKDIRAELLATMKRIDVISHSRWHFYRKLLNPYDFTCRNEAVNRAFYKLWEILQTYPELLEESNPIYTLHLAEAPGSFIQVMRKVLRNCDWRPLAVSRPLSTYADVVKKSLSIPKFHPTITEPFVYLDLTNTCDIQKLRGLSENTTKSEGFHFITADGGFDEEEQYNEKEVLHYKLILGEIIAILLNQRMGGSCCLKIFDTFTATTVSILNLLCQHYKYFTVVKPSTSRPTNSEKYLLCREFLGQKFSIDELLKILNVETIQNGMFISSPLFTQEHIDLVTQEILEETKSCALAQISHISQVLQMSDKYIDRQYHEANKRRVYQEWCEAMHYIAF